MCCSPIARSGPRCRCAAGRTWSARSASCSPSPISSSSCSRSRPFRPAPTRVCFCFAALVTCVLALSAWAVIPVKSQLGDRRHQCRHLVYFRDLLALLVYGVIAGGVGVEARNIPSWRRCARRRRWCPTRSRSDSSLSPILLCVGSLNLTDIVKAQDGSWGLLGWFWLLPLFPDVRDLLHLGAVAETNRPPFDPGGGGIRAGRHGFMVEYGSALPT